ncbi:hypothetical protein COLO4_06408 [Corchorus olitorius]|uniref:Nucleic acid-binding protein n=1 Tax=Corchorus olitorius TaxID=93759 RepID=A0A1R3KN35_9ROSI|nr:hypothetical protein COLO4_06408 [Corchorus olitorius]
MPQVTIAQLRQGTVDQSIRLRVTRIWIHRDQMTRRAFGMAFVAADSTGEAIHVQISPRNIDYYRAIIIEGFNNWLMKTDSLQINEAQLLTTVPRPVMIFAGVVAKTVENQISLISYSATRLYVNLHIQETVMVHAQYADVIGPIEMLPGDNL